MKQLTRKVFSLVIVMAMLFGMFVPVSATYSGYQSLAFRETDEATGVQNESLIPAESTDEVDLDAPRYDADEIVRVSIVLEKQSTLDKGFSTQSIAANSAAVSYRQSLKNEQENVTAAIEETTGEALDVQWNLTLTANIISAYVPYGQIEEILDVDGVQDVVIETRYEPCVTEENPVYDPNMGTSSAQIGSTAAWTDGYTGAGSRIAIIDTGIDTDHQSFAASGYEYSLAQRAEELDMTVEDYMDSLDLLTVEEIESVLGDLNVHTDYSANATAADLYKTSKIPFGYNYIDLDAEYIEHDMDQQSGHGSHVAGIASANAYIPNADGGFDEALTAAGVKGVAPDAQLIIMKVFGKYGGAYDSDYMAAIEDAIVLNCDSINLSLGSAAPGFVTNSTYQNILDSLVESDTVVTISAGNSYGWAEFANTDLYAEDVSMDTVGSPGSYTNSLAVASVENTGTFGEYFVASGVGVVYNETSYKNNPMKTIAGDYEYIFIDGIGTDADFAALGDALEGKVAFCFRGTTSFYEKAENAVKYGAIATVVCNNQSGTINMDLTDYSKTQPVVSITLSEANAIREASTAVKDENGEVLYYTGDITICDTPSVVVSNSEYYTISAFSSWGVPGSLTLKPEITAPGGNIYSIDGETKGGTAYTNMSGTSMAAPQMAGMAALMAQYIRENDLMDKTDLTMRGLSQSLLMSTAVPMYESEGVYFPVIRQGAGLANVGKAVDAKSYVVMDEDATASWMDGKVKAELGEDKDRTGVYTFSFTLNNLTDEAQDYILSADLFTQDIFTDGEYTYMDTQTTALDYLAAWTADGKTVEPIEDVSRYDFDGNGIVNYDDVQILLDHAAGYEAPLNNAAYADLNGDGAIGTYDAYLLLKKLNSAYAELPAGGSVEITVTLTLTDAQKEALEQDACGAYIEGYVYAEENSSEEGVEGTSHSIPVLAYYGSWTEPSMYDKSSYIDRLYGDTTLSYFSGRVQNYLTLKRADNAESYIHTGNPYLLEDSNPVECYAINPNSQFYQMHFATIRNAGTYSFVAQDAEGNVRYMYAPSKNLNSAYYYVNGSAWQNTGWVSTFNVTPARMGFSEGDTITFSAVMIPEYYSMEKELSTDDVRNLVQNDQLGEGAYQSYTFTLDATAPEALNIYQDVETGDIVVECKDNNYVAVVQVQTLNGRVLAEVVPEKGARGESCYARIDMSGIKVGTEAIILVGDYAMNEKAYVVEVDGEPIDYTGEIYGFTNSSFRGGGGNRWVNIVTDDLWYYSNDAYDGIETIQKVDLNVTAAEYVDGFVFMAATDGYFYVAQHDMWLDATRASYYKSTTGTIKDMAFDYKNKVMYVMDANNTLWTMDLNSTALTKVGSITLETNRVLDKGYQRQITSLTADNDGNLYVVNWGGEGQTFLHRFTVDDFVDGKIENLSPVTDSRTGVMHCPMGTGSIAYDHDNDVIYATGDLLGAGQHAYMAVIDPKTGVGQPVTTEDGGYGSSNASRTSLNILGLYVVPTNDANAIEMTDEASKIELNRNSVSGLVGMETALTAYVTNWNVRDKSVTWESSDPSVATVTSAGRVQMVGVGEATITATTNAAPYLTAECAVKVVEVPAVDMSAMVVDSNGDAHWVDFNTAAPEEYEIIADASKQYYSGSVLGDTIYVHDGSRVYAVDADYFTEEASISVSTDWRWSDATGVPTTKQGFGLLATISAQGRYIALLNPETGEIPEAFNLSSYLGSDRMAVIARGERTAENTYLFYVLTEQGTLLGVSVKAYEHLQFGTRYEVSFWTIGETGVDLTGVASVSSYQASILYDEESGYLFLSAYVGGNMANLYAINPDDALCVEIGSFGSDIWPVVSLYQFDRADDLTVRIAEEDASVYVDSYVQLNAKIIKAESDTSVIWESEDESIATVDENGLVKGVSEGTVTITATSVETDSNGEYASDSIEVTILPLLEMDTTVNAQIVNEDGEAQWVTIDTADGSYTVNAENASVVSAGGGHKGQIVAVNENNQLITVDPETFEEEVHGTFDDDDTIRDLTTMPGDELEVVDYWSFDRADGVPYGIPLAIMDKDINISMIPDYDKVTEKDRKYQYWGLSIWEVKDNVATVAYIGHTFKDDSHAGMMEGEIFYSVAADGRLREFVTFPWWYDYYYEPEAGFTYTLTCNTIANIGVTFEDQYGMSMTYIKDETHDGLLLADTNSYGVDLYWIDLSEGTDYQAQKICTLDGATAIAALYTQDDLDGTMHNDDVPNRMWAVDEEEIYEVYYADEPAPFAIESVEEESEEIDEEALERSILDAAGSLTPVYNHTFAAATTTATVAATTAEVAEEASVEGELVELVAKTNTTNALFVVEWDAQEADLVAYSANTTMESARITGSSKKTLTYAVVNSEAAEAGTVLVKLYFQLNEKVDVTKITVTTEERNAAFPGSKETFTLGKKPVPAPVGPTPVTPVEPVKPVQPTQPDEPVTPVEKELPFIDVGDTWYTEYVRFVYENGIMTGVTADTFEPATATTRGMIVTMLARMEGVDTSGSPWYAAGQAWAMENGISDGTNMSGEITREQLVTMLYRYAQFKGYDVSARAELGEFTDAGSVSAWAQEAMQWAVAVGLIQGNNGQLMPSGSASRAETATMITRFMQYYAA